MARHMWGRINTGWWAAAVACSALASGCMAEALPPVVDEDEDHDDEEGLSQRDASLVEALGEVAPLTIAGSSQPERGSLIQIEAGRAEVDEVGTESSHSLELSVLGGYIDVRALDDRTVAIRDFVVDIDDIALPGGLVSANVEFTGVRAQIIRPETVNVTWGEGRERAEAIVALDLEVEWGVSVDDGAMHPLAPVKIDDLEIILELSRGESGAVAAQIAGFREDVFYEWGGMVELRGLAVDVRAEET